MKSFTEEDYLELFKQLEAAENTPEEFEDLIDYEPITKPKYIDKDINKVINLTEVKKNQIKDKLHNCGWIRINNFLVRIKNYSSDSAQVKLDLIIHEEKKNVAAKIDPKLDLRFKGRPWLNYFNGLKVGTKIPLEIAVDIIKWLQILKKIPAFT